MLQAIGEKKHNFTGNFGVEAPVFWLLWRRDIILLGKFGSMGGGWWSYLVYVQNYAGGRLEFHYMVHAPSGGWSSRSSNFIGVSSGTEINQSEDKMEAQLDSSALYQQLCFMI